MTSTLGTDQPSARFIPDDFKGHQLAGRVAPEAGLQLPYLDLDDPGFTWPTHPLVGLPPLTPLVPADRLGADHPEAAVQPKRNRNTLRGQTDVDILHEATLAAGPEPLPTRRSLRVNRTAESETVRTYTQSLPVIAADEPAVPVEPVAEVPTEDLMDPLALADELEAALFAALAEEQEPQPAPSARSLRLARAQELVNGPTTADSEYVSMIKSYGPFPTLLPALRDFRPVLVLSIFGGFLGLDRFYAGKHASGLLKLATAGGAGIWWIADILAILSGRASDKNGRRFAGDKQHLLIAWVLTGALFAGLTPVLVNTAVPALTAGTGTVRNALFPKPAPVPTWGTIANITGAPNPTVLAVTGDRLRLTYNFPGPVYAYLQKDGDTSVPTDSLLLNDAAMTGTKEVAIKPGTYRLVIRAEGAAWTVKVEELGLHG